MGSDNNVRLWPHIYFQVITLRKGFWFKNLLMKQILKNCWWFECVTFAETYNTNAEEFSEHFVTEVVQKLQQNATPSSERILYNWRVLDVCSKPSPTYCKHFHFIKITVDMT